MRSLYPLLLFIGSLFSNQTLAKGPCESAQHQQFNFWLGSWQVLKPDGSEAGINHITSNHGGCVLSESYRTKTGYQGESLNIYDASRNVWHQTWVDNTGLLLKLEGKFDGSSMVLQGKTKDQSGKYTLHKITWTPNKNGTVRQHWQTAQTKDQWQTAFDGLYVKLGS